MAHKEMWSLLYVNTKVVSKMVAKHCIPNADTCGVQINKYVHGTMRQFQTMHLGDT